MAQNAIEILIDVLASEGIASVEELTKVLSGAARKTEVLAGTIDDLDVTLKGLTRNGLSAEEMIASMVSALMSAGIQFKDADELVATLTKGLTNLGAAGEKAASGVDLTNTANEQLVGSADSAAAALEREAAAAGGLGTASGAAASALKGLQVSAAANAAMQKEAMANLGSGYAKMTSLADMATPALMKAATWAGVGLAGLAYEGIKQYTQFNKLITQTITQAGVSPAKFGFLSGLAESVAKKTGQGLTDVANTIYRAASGTASWNNGLGATKKQLADIVTTTSKLNVVGGVATGAESEQASRVITALLNSNIRGVGHSPVSAAALTNAIVGSGDMRWADLVPGIGRGLLSSAVANNLSAQDTLSWVAALTSTGTTASVASNYVKTGINLLAHPSAQGVQALAMLGIKPGQLENLMSGPGGLVSALSTLKAAMSKLSPGNAGFFFHEAGLVRKGGSGMAGAIAKLQSWSANELNPKFIADWKAGKLTPQEQTQATDLILTKAFGGSKQFATIAAVLNKLGLIKGIEAHVTAENTPGYFNAQYARTAATPAQQFKRMHQSLIVDLVKIGKELTPLGLLFGHVMTGTIGALSKFKGVLVGFALLAGGLLAAAGAAKVATLASHLSPLIGAGYNRLGLMAGEKSAFTTAMNEKANSGAFKFLNIYQTHEKGILSKLGGASINAGLGLSDAQIGAGETVAGISKGENALVSAQARGNTFLEKITVNTQMAADELAKNGIGGAGGGGAGGKLKAAEKKIANLESKSGLLALGPGTLERGTQLTHRYGGGAIALTSSADQLMAGSVFMDAKSGRWTKRLANGRTSFISKAEAMAAQEQPVGSYVPRDAQYIGKDPALRGMANIASDATNLVSGEVKSVVPNIVGDVAKTGMLSSLGSSLGGLAGGPLGMVGMMMAPMVIAQLTPALGKLGSLIDGWLGGGTPAFQAHLKHMPMDSTQASAKVKKALAVLRQYQTEIKGKNGKISWVRNNAAYLADPLGYDKALKKYELDTHTYQGSIKNSNSISKQAISTLYGPQSHLLAKDLRMSKELSGHLVAGPHGSYMSKVGSEAQMLALTRHLPLAVKNAVTQMIKNRGVNWQDFSKILKKDQSLARGVLTDTFGSSAQWQGAHAKLAGSLVSGGYFSAAHNLALNTAEMNRALSRKGATAAEAAKFLPSYAHQYHLQMAADNKAILSKTTSPDAKAYFKEQKVSAENSLKKTDALILEMRKAASNTKLAGESVDRMAHETAAQIAASGLTADSIGRAVASAVSRYMRPGTVVGAGGGGTRSRPPVPLK